MTASRPGVSSRRRERLHAGVATGEVRVVAGARSALFLPFEQLGLIVRKQQRFFATAQRIHLNPDDIFVQQHHVNWRQKSMAHLEQKFDRNHVHYSGPMAISRESFTRIQSMLIRLLQDIEDPIAAAGEDTACALCIDFYEL